MSDYIGDFGEKIGGARKDLWVRRGLSLEDLEYLNLKEYAENVIKAHIWPLPDYRKFKGKMETVCIMYMKFARDKLPAKIAFYGDGRDTDRAEEYIKVLQKVRSLCEQMKVEADIPEVYRAVHEFFKSEKLKYSDYSIPYNLIVSSSGIKDLKIEAEIQNFPDEYKGVLKGILIKKTYGNKWVIHNKTRYLTAKRFDTFTEALDYAKNELADELEEKRSTKKKSTLVNIVRPQLEHIERFGPDIREGENVTTGHMLNAFMFRGGEFGNWNTQEDRQAFLNYAFDAFVDLAYAMDMPVGFIGLGQKGDRDNLEVKI